MEFEEIYEPEPIVDHLSEFKKTMIGSYRSDIHFLQRDIALMTIIRETAKGEDLRICRYIIGDDLLRISEVKHEMGRIRDEY